MASTQQAEAADVATEAFPSSVAVALRTAPAMELASPADIEYAMRQFDGEQFMAEVLGQALDKWFYAFKVAGKQVEGVSAKGAHEFARLRAEQGFPIRFPMDGVRLEEISQNGETGIRAIVIAREYRTGLEAIGMAFYPYYEERKSGEKVFDRMADRKALAVAERNAILRLTPERAIIQALRLRAEAVARNERQLKEEQRSAIARAPEARRVTAGTAEERHDLDPYKHSGHEQPRRGAPSKRTYPGDGASDEAKLAWASSLRLRGKPDKWGGNGSKPMGDISSEVLSSAAEFFAGKLKEAPGDGALEDQVLAARIVLHDRERAQTALDLDADAATDATPATSGDDDLPF